MPLLAARSTAPAPRRAVARRNTCERHRWLATPLHELVATLKRMLGGRPAGLKARIWLDVFFNDQRSPQVPEPLFPGILPPPFRASPPSPPVRFRYCTCKRVCARTLAYTQARLHRHACTSTLTRTAGDCEGGGGRQTHLSHGAPAHRHRRPGSLACALTHLPHTRCAHSDARVHTRYRRGCGHNQADSRCERQTSTSMRRNVCHSPASWKWSSPLLLVM